MGNRSQSFSYKPLGIGKDYSCSTSSPKIFDLRRISGTRESIRSCCHYFILAGSLQVVWACERFCWAHAHRHAFELHRILIDVSRCIESDPEFGNEGFLVASLAYGFKDLMPRWKLLFERLSCSHGTCFMQRPVSCISHAFLQTSFWQGSHGGAHVFLDRLFLKPRRRRHHRSGSGIKEFWG